MNTSILKNVRILFVEDDEVQRNQLLTYLKRRVNKVYTAKNGLEGYEKYKNNKPDIILTDLRMPKMDGIELAKKIREENRLIPIIVATAMNDKETILKTVDIGITNYIVKPVDTDELLSVLVNCVKTLLAANQSEFETIVDKEKVNTFKNYLTKYLKKETGKGPSDIRIVITQSECEISIRDYITLYEKNMIADGKNEQLVNHSRNIFFEDRKFILEEKILEDFHMQFKFQSVKSDVKANELLLLFSLQ